MRESNKISVKFKNVSNNPDPEYGKEYNSGFDLRAFLPEDSCVEIPPLGRVLIPTGLFFELPEGYEMQIRPRSGLAWNHGITVLNTPATIDNDYRGEIKVILSCLSETGFSVINGDRIAQAVISKVNYGKLVDLEKINEISENTERGTTGFGNSGIK